MLLAIFTENTLVVTLTGLFQWDYGQKLYIQGLDMDLVSEVHFSNSKEKEAIVMPAVKEGEYITCMIPDVLLTKDLDITAWVYDVQPTSGETVRTITLKVEPRTKPNNFTEFVPDGELILSDIVNLVNQSIADNEQWQQDLEADYEQFKSEVGTIASEGLIDDEKTELISTWSSQKIQQELDGLEGEFLLKSDIKDTETTATNLWSAQKVNTELSTRDNNLNSYKTEVSNTYATKTAVTSEITSAIDNSTQIKTVKLLTTAWTADGTRGYKQTVTTDISGSPLNYTADSSPYMDVATVYLNNAETARSHIDDWNLVYGAEANASGITFYADEALTNEIQVTVKGD